MFYYKHISESASSFDFKRKKTEIYVNQQIVSCSLLTFYTHLSTGVPVL